MDMKKILATLDGVASTPVTGSNDMRKFLSIIKESAVANESVITSFEADSIGGDANTFLIDADKINDLVMGNIDKIKINADEQLLKDMMSKFNSFMSAYHAVGKDILQPGLFDDKMGDEVEEAMRPGFTHQDAGAEQDRKINALSGFAAKAMIAAGMTDFSASDDSTIMSALKNLPRLRSSIDQLDDSAFNRFIDATLTKAAALVGKQDVPEGVRDLGYDAQSLIMKLRRDVEDKRLQPTRQAVLSAASELAGDMDFAPELLVRQVLGQRMAEDDASETMTPNWAKYVLKQLYQSQGDVTLTDLFDEGIPGLHAMFIATAEEHGLDPEEDFEDVQHELTLELEDLIGGTDDLGENLSFKDYFALSESLKTDNPCWKGYKPVGKKKKNGKTVPNCVPKTKGN